MADTAFINGTVVQADWLNDVNEITYKATQQKTGAVDRAGVDKVTEIPSLDDFNGNMANFEAAADGGLAIIPRSTYSFGTYELTQDGVYINGSTNWLSSFLHNVGETPGTTTTRQLTLTTTTGTNAGKKRFGEISRLSSAGAGSTILLDGTGDFANGVISTKANYSGAASAGEIGGNYTVVRQGGTSGSLNDCSAELYNVSTYSPSFACLTEGLITKLNSSSVITHSMHVQTGYLNAGTSDMGGVAVAVNTGTASNLYTSSVASGAGATNLLRHVNFNRASDRREIIRWTGQGHLNVDIGADLGGTLGNTVPFRTVQTHTDNKDGIEERMFRTANGTNHTTAEYRMYRLIDSAVGGGITFGYEAVRGHTVSLTIGGNPYLKVGTNQSVGFNGATPITRPVLPAAATDLASAISLVNAIRSALINYGLAT